jgi:hypothetical protein
VTLHLADGSHAPDRRIVGGNKPLALVYYLKEDLRQFWEQTGKQFATAFLNDWIRRAKA